MAEKRYYWLKLKEDYLSSPKIKKLRKIAGGDTYTIIYLKMQLLSISNGGIIEFEGIENTFEEELALKLDENVDDVQMTLAYLRQQSLMEANENEYLFIEASNNIGSEGQSAERKRRFDEKKKVALLCNDSVTQVERTSISISSSISKSNKRFVPPTLDEIISYCQERNNSVDAQKFFDYFQTSGWVDSKGNKVKNWKQKIITWEQNTKPNPKQEYMTHNYTKEQCNSLIDNIDELEI